MKIFHKIVVLFGLFLGALPGAHATRYVLSDSGDTLVGEIIIVKADQSETLLDIARRNGFGYQDMKLVNPEVDTWMPVHGEEVTLPSLPPV